MGKVFSPETVAAYQVPEPSAHQEAALYLASSLSDERHRNGMNGMVFGSVVLGQANIRSDLDLLAIIPEGADEFAASISLARHVSEVKATWKVPVDASIITANDLTTRQHPVTKDPLFAEHLVQAARSTKYSFGKPEDQLLPLVAFQTAGDQLRAAVHITQSYTSGKRKEFFGALVDDTEPANLSKLQRAFELPSALGRKLLRLQELAGWAVINSFPHSPHTDNDFYARQPLAEGMVRLLEESGQATAPAHWLIRHDSEYTSLLNSTLQGHTKITEYESWLVNTHQPAMRHALHLAIAASTLVKKAD